MAGRCAGTRRAWVDGGTQCNVCANKVPIWSEGNPVFWGGAGRDLPEVVDSSNSQEMTKAASRATFAVHARSLT